jgi:hypothetical protein
MRTVDEILTDFNLHEASPRPLMEQRLHVLAAFVRDYERSYELLSQTLQKRTAMLRDTQLEAATLSVKHEALWVKVLRKDELVRAVLFWHMALGSTDEAQYMAILRETITGYLDTQTTS